MADAIAAFREPPFNIKVRTPYTAGTAFQAAFMIDRDTVAFLPVDICRTKIQARLLFTLILADFSVNYFKMTFLIHLKPVEK